MSNDTASKPSASMQKQPTDKTNAVLSTRLDLTEELAIFRVTPDSGPVPDFKPGQYTTLGLMETEAEAAGKLSRSGKPRKPKLVLRAYSIASAPPPIVSDYLEFFLVVVEDGQLTPKLWQLEEGDRLFLGPKITGKFTLDDVPEGKDLVMICTGTGLAPYLSMYHMYKNTGRWRKFVIIHGTRMSSDLGYRAELEQAAEEDPSLVYIPTVTREPDESNWEGLRGRVHVALEPKLYQELVGAPLDPEQAHVFLCGNPAMIDQVTEDLTHQGFVPKDREHPEGNIHVESYW